MREPLPFTPTGLHWATCYDPQCGGCVSDEQLQALRAREVDRQHVLSEPLRPEPAPGWFDPLPDGTLRDCPYCGRGRKAVDLWHDNDRAGVQHVPAAAWKDCPGSAERPRLQRQHGLPPGHIFPEARFVLVMLPMMDDDQ